jgi:chromosome segregation ATPase
VVFLFEAKYNVAISTACAGLDYIVVETTSATQRCDELLRRENAGVATFMILVTFNLILYNIQELILSKKLP